MTFFPEMTTRGSSVGRAESDGPVGISEVPGRMLRKRDTLPGRAWRCFVKIHLFPQFAPKREPPGEPGEAVGEAVWRKGPNSLAHTGPQMGLLRRCPFRTCWSPFGGAVSDPHLEAFLVKK